MAGRRTKYTPELVKSLIELLEQGNTDVDSCGLVGISQETFYTWIKTKPEFSEQITYARSKARRAAVAAWRNGMLPNVETIDTTETFSETRLDKEGKPYEYKRTTQKKQVINHPADWRAAEAYLKRRDPDSWGDVVKQKISGEDGGPVSIRVVFEEKKNA